VSVFRFKQFEVAQSRSAMKVGTDGVLLGAWCSAKNRSHVLDVGTGTGLLALMIAQRNSTALIEALDLDLGAVEDARLNFSNSPWSDRLKIHHSTLEHFDWPKLFDLIICNPPFFVNSLKNPDLAKAQARHTASLSPQELASLAQRLSPEGVLAGIYPADTYPIFEESAARHSLFPSRICEIRPTPEKAVNRILFEFAKTSKEVEKSTLTIEAFGRHVYSNDYIFLTAPFYLNM